MAALSESFAEPRFSCRQVQKVLKSSLRLVDHFQLPVALADLSAGDLFADEEVHLCLVSWGVVGATGGGQAVPTCPPGLLVVTGQGFC